MGTKQIIAELDTAIARLEQAKSVLADETVRRKPGRPKGATAVTTVKKRKMSPRDVPGSWLL